MTKALYTQVGEVKGKKSEDQFTFTHQYSPSSDELKHSRGSLYAVVNLHNTSDSEAVKLDRDIFQTFQSSYYSTSVGGILTSLENAFEQIKKFLEGKEKAEAIKFDYDFVAAVLWGEALYLVKSQNTSVIFQRGKVAKELQFNKTASGSIKDKDNIFLVSKSYLEQLGVEKIIESLAKEDFQDALKGLNEVSADSALTDGLFIRVYLEEPKQQTVEMVDVEERRSGILSDKIGKIQAKVSNLFYLFWIKAISSTNSLRRTVLVYLALGGNKILEPWRPREPGNVEDPAKRRRARAFQIAVVLVLLLTLSVGLALNSRSNSGKERAFEEKLSVVEGTLDEAENLTEINPGRSEELLVKVGKDLEEAKDFGIKSDSLDKLEERYKTLQETISNIYSVDLEEFTNLSISVDEFVLAQESFVVLDRGKSKIIKIDKISKEEKEISSDSGINQITVFEKTLYVQSKDGIKKVDLGSLISSYVQDAGSTWGNIVGADTYQGNLYLLDSTNKEVWKYARAGSGLSLPQKYFKKKPGIENPAAIAIDGAIWIGDKEGKILKFLGGNEQKFDISGLDKPMGEIADIFTTEGSTRLFVLDKGNGRILVLDKSGKYVSQHVGEDFKKATTLVVDENAKTVYIGVGESIKSFKY